MNEIAPSSQEVLDSYSGKTVLITGGAGMIGSNLTRALLRTDTKKIIVLDDLSASYEWNIPRDPRVEFVKGSILDEGKTGEAFAQSPQVVFHLAAHFANQNSVEHPESDLMVNGLGTLRILELSRKAGAERVVYASSGCSVYGSNAPLPLKESFVTLHLDTPYQMNKLVGELYCNYYNDYYQFPVAICRYFNVFGPGEVPGKYRDVIPNFIWWAMHGKPLPITGTGEETRDFTYVDDIVDGSLRMGVLPEAVGEAVNLASGTETKILDLANEVNELTESKGGVVFRGRRDWDKSGRRRASIEKARTLLGYNPRTAFHNGLLLTLTWIRQNSAIIESLPRD